MNREEKIQNLKIRMKTTIFKTNLAIFLSIMVVGKYNSKSNFRKRQIIS
jgi:hypothetical protein